MSLVPNYDNIRQFFGWRNFNFIFLPDSSSHVYLNLDWIMVMISMSKRTPIRTHFVAPG